MVRLEDITKDQILKGLDSSGNAVVISAEMTGVNAVTVCFRLQDNTTRESMLFRSDEQTLELVERGLPWSFDADPKDFKLGAEAYRIRLAHLFDPLLAVHTASVDPLPHQITAVYEAMLPKQPLRFLLADDPGAGKTIMAGLLIRELMARGDVKRCLIIAPGSLVEQWQDELEQKFNLHFNIFSREQVESSRIGNPFEEKDSLIARVDQLARAEDLQEKLKVTDWDLVIVDEAHKMSASFYGDQLNETKRFKLGKLVGSLTRHFLLMTATPHNGKEEDFQAFMSLLDSDRFFGKFRDGVHQVEVEDLMRRMVKEELLKFDGTRLFPERRSYTVNYELSELEAALYASVTKYVVEEMNRADDLEEKRRGTVGFALTMLQRRLASSPEAIFQSLSRRERKLSDMRQELKLHERGLSILGNLSSNSTDWDEAEEDFTEEELEEIEDEVLDKATAARTVEELDREISVLKGLIQQAKQVVRSGEDRKWRELSNILQDNKEMYEPDGRTRRKIIIFTEHKDTLNYLYDKLTDLVGQQEMVQCIHGGVRREERKKVQELFTQDKNVHILLATDAAGEGVNLQRANLMLNYDLPWNPNRLEQRFGRIHRIGQTEVCHLWNLVASETREGSVFQRLFEKLEVERERFGGKVFDVLGMAINNRSLKELLMEAIKYGEQPEVRARLNEKVDEYLGPEMFQKLINEHAISSDIMNADRVFRIKEDMERAQARRLQPHYIFSYFKEAFNFFSGQLREREPDRFEITHVPASIRERDRTIGSGAPVLKRYERLCFDREKVRVPNKPLASLLAPGHPLMDATIDLALEQFRPSLKQGSILVNRGDDDETPKILFILDHSIKDGRTTSDGRQRVISQKLQFIYLDREGNLTSAGHAPYLDLESPSPSESSLISSILEEDWLKGDFERKVMAYAADKIVPAHLEETKDRRLRMVDATRRAVHERLTKEINHWTHRYNELKAASDAGKQPRMQPENARRRAEELTARLQTRTSELEKERAISSSPPIIVGGALVVPQGWLCQADSSLAPPDWSADAAARKRVEMAGMRAVMEKERALGYEPDDVSSENRGWDIESKSGNGNLRLIEVKARAKGATTITVTRNEILACLNKPESFLLAIVLVDGDTTEGPYYVTRPFEQELGFGVTSVNLDLSDMLSVAEEQAPYRSIS